MKELNLRKSLFLLFLFISLSNLNAQIGDPESGPSTFPPGTAIIDNQRATNFNSIGLELDGCLGLVPASVFTTNLEYDEDLEAYVLPQDATPIYLSYSIGGQQGLIPVTTFQEYHDPLYPNPPLQLYEAQIDIPVSFMNSCYPETPNDNGAEYEEVPQQENPGNVAVWYALEIVQIVNNQVYPYPFFLNDDPEGVFSCLIFCNECDDISPSGYKTCIRQSHFNSWSNTMPINCGECDYSSPEVEETPETSLPGGGNYIQNDIPISINQDAQINSNESLTAPESTSDIKLDLSGIKIIPNPAHSKTELVFQSQKNEVIDIVIYNANGQVVYTTQGETFKGINRNTITIENWESGLYFGQIRSGSNNHFFKITKVN